MLYDIVIQHIGMSCHGPSWQWHRTGSRWSSVRTLPVAPLWCDLGFFPNSRGNKPAANLRPSKETQKRRTADGGRLASRDKKWTVNWAVAARRCVRSGLPDDWLLLGLRRGGIHWAHSVGPDLQVGPLNASQSLGQWAH